LRQLGIRSIALTTSTSQPAEHRSAPHPEKERNRSILSGRFALSAAELMTGSRTRKIRRCQDDRGCGGLFVDESRLQNRPWCCMGDCGKLAKARRHGERAPG
jgi:predicted RNA-binding Zn ribbon-like protein